MNCVARAQDRLLIMKDALHQMLNPQVVVGAGVAPLAAIHREGRLDPPPALPSGQQINGRRDSDGVQGKGSFQSVQLDHGRATGDRDAVSGQAGQPPMAKVEKHLPIVVGLHRYTLAGNRAIFHNKARQHFRHHGRYPLHGTEQTGENMERIDAHVQRWSAAGGEEG